MRLVWVRPLDIGQAPGVERAEEESGDLRLVWVRPLDIGQATGS